MGCGKYLRIRAKDVGRPGHHYILVGIRKKKGPRGGRTKRISGLRKYKNYKSSSFPSLSRKKLKKLIGV